MTPKMLPVRVWSCPLHEYPETHECDCGFCELPHYLCEQCATAKWVDKLDANGDPVMREATPMDMLVDMNLRAIGEQLSRPLMITSPLIAWAETDNIPTVETKP